MSPRHGFKFSFANERQIMAVTISAAGSEVTLPGSSGSPGISLNFSTLISGLPPGQTIEMNSGDIDSIRDVLSAVDINSAQITTISGGAQMITSTVNGTNTLSTTIVMPTSSANINEPISLPSSNGSQSNISLTAISGAALTVVSAPSVTLDSLDESVPLSAEIIQLISSLPGGQQVQISPTNASIGTIGASGNVVSFQGAGDPTNAVVVSGTGIGGAQVSMTGGSLIVANGSGPGANILANNATILASDGGDQVRVSGSSNIVTAGGNDIVVMNSGASGGLINLGSGDDVLFGSTTQGGGTSIVLGSGNNTLVIGGSVTSGLTNFINSSLGIRSAIEGHSDLGQFVVPSSGSSSGSGSFVMAGLGNDTIFNLHTHGPGADHLTIGGGGYSSYFVSSDGVVLTTVSGSTVNIVGSNVSDLIGMYESGLLQFV